MCSNKEGLPRACSTTRTILRGPCPEGAMQLAEEIERPRSLRRGAKKIVARLEDFGFPGGKIEPNTHTVPHGRPLRGGPFIEAVSDRPNGTVRRQNFGAAGDRGRYAPARPPSCRRIGKKGPTLRWMENIQPWCISRQLWWGHSDPGRGTGPTTRCVPSRRPRKKAVGNAPRLLRRGRK